MKRNLTLLLTCTTLYSNLLSSTLKSSTCHPSESASQVPENGGCASPCLGPAIFMIYLSTNRHLHYVPKSSIRGKASPVVGMHTLLAVIDFISLGHTSRTGAARMYGSSNFNDLRHVYSVFNNVAPIPSLRLLYKG